MTTPSIGFIGQGWIGKHYADDFEARGHSVVRYALEAPYNKNKEAIGTCDIVFVAVPTPSTPKGFDDSIVRGVLSLVGKGKTVVLKSTLLPGTTNDIQKENPHLIVLDSPEFLSEATAAYDTAHPFANIVGMPITDAAHEAAAKAVHAVLPHAPFTLTCSSDESEIIKYAHNVSGYTQIVTFNLFYDLAQSMGHGWEKIGQAIMADPYISSRYANPVHKSGRGAGGHCFIKDFAAFSEAYREHVEDTLGLAALNALRDKNNDLLRRSGKDLDLLDGVYGK